MRFGYCVRRIFVLHNPLLDLVVIGVLLKLLCQILYAAIEALGSCEIHAQAYATGKGDRIVRAKNVYTD